MKHDEIEMTVIGQTHAQGEPPTLQQLLERMQDSSEFPALSAAVMRIQALVSSESENLHTLSSEIIKDVALTQKLLRLVNTAQFSHAGAGGIGTVSRAVALIGFSGVRNLALSLVLLEHMPDRAHASRLRHEYLRALLSASLAGELSMAGGVGEEAFVGTLFQSLGRLLTEAYLPAEAERIRALCPLSGATRDAAARQVLGMTLPQLGLGVAQAWCLPESLQRCMDTPSGDEPRRAAAPGSDRLRWLGRVSQELADLLLSAPPDKLPALVLQLAQRSSLVLDINAREIAAAAERIRAALRQWARALGLEDALNAVPVLAGPPLPRRRDDVPAVARAVTPAAPSATPAAVAAAEAHAAPPAEPPGVAMLTAGALDITEALLADPLCPDDVVRVLIEAVFRALQARYVVLCLHDDASGELVGRHAVGLNAGMTAAAFHVPLAASARDPFALLCSNGADTLIADAASSQIAARLPDWYRQHFAAGTFLLMPLMYKQRPLGLLYADKALANSLAPSEREWLLLRTLRNQALLALRPAAS